MKIKRNTRELPAMMSDWLRVYLPGTRFRSRHTIDSYESSLSLYLDFLEKNKQVTETTIDEECFRGLFWCLTTDEAKYKPILLEKMIPGLKLK